LNAGILPHRIVLDPGIGFGKRLRHNLEILGRLPELRSLGLPLLLGVSRKSFIAHVTERQHPDDWNGARAEDRPSDRLGGTAAAVTACVLAGAAILRVHDVEVMVEAARVAAAVRAYPAQAAR
jgi:dihydropteroate synthase